MAVAIGVDPADYTGYSLRIAAASDICDQYGEGEGLAHRHPPRAVGDPDISFIYRRGAPEYGGRPAGGVGDHVRRQGARDGGPAPGMVAADDQLGATSLGLGHLTSSGAGLGYRQPDHISVLSSDTSAHR